MFTTLAGAAAIATSLSALPEVPATQFTYATISAPEQADLTRAVEQAIRGLAPPGVTARRAPLDTTRMQACLAERTGADRANPCIRALLPERVRGGPVIALRVSVQVISNITGTRRHYRHQLHCIGARSIGTAALGDHATPAGAYRSASAAEIRTCLATAMTPRNAAMLGRDPRTRAPLWRLPFTRYVPESAGEARGRGSEQAIVTLLQIRHRPNRDGQCLVRARLGRVEGYFSLREGDLIEMTAPCTGDARAHFARAVAPTLRRGSRARVYVGYDGDFLFLEPL